MLTTDTHEALVDAYLAMWNESDRHARRSLIDRVMSAEATYVDPLADVARSRSKRGPLPIATHTERHLQPGASGVGD